MQHEGQQSAIEGLSQAVSAKKGSLTQHTRDNRRNDEEEGMNQGRREGGGREEEEERRRAQKGGEPPTARHADDRCTAALACTSLH